MWKVEWLDMHTGYVVVVILYSSLARAWTQGVAEKRKDEYIVITRLR